MVFFASKIVASVLGFAATVYVARLLGADALGIYSLALAVVAWLGIAGNMGVTAGIKKRVSEQEEPAAYAVAGALLMAALFLLLAALVVLFRGQVNDYVRFPVAGFVVAMLGVTLAYNTVTALLNGQHLVHVTGLFSPLKTGGRAGLQIAALLAGFGLAGLFGGYVVGYSIVVALGGYVVWRSLGGLVIPRRHHFRRILSFAKYAWLGGLRSRAFNWVDIALLGFFVSSSLIGFYTAAWNIAQFLIVFATAISQTLFPKMSENAASDDSGRVSDLLNSALSYAGLILIPGLVGGTILGRRILRIYGPEFTRAGLVLSILIVSTLLQSYQKQFTTTLNALDRPDRAFRVNFVFIAANVALNVVLIAVYGWVGAAVATTTSVGVSLVVAYRYVDSLLDFVLPTGEIAKQWFAAGLMGGVVLVLLRLEAAYVNLGHNAALVASLVSVGAGVYFGALLVLSSRFRTTVRDNVPAWSQ